MSITPLPFINRELKSCALLRTRITNRHPITNHTVSIADTGIGTDRKDRMQSGTEAFCTTDTGRTNSAAHTPGDTDQMTRPDHNRASVLSPDATDEGRSNVVRSSPLDHFKCRQGELEAWTSKPGSTRRYALPGAAGARISRTCFLTGFRVRAFRRKPVRLRR